MQISVSGIIRFFHEMSRIHWTHESLIFLDEVSFDNRGMLRKRGYAIKVVWMKSLIKYTVNLLSKGEKLLFRCG